jgi:hypothetical protein
MYGLPKNIDLSFLVGKTIIQVCVGFNEIILNLDEGHISICIQSACACHSEDGSTLQIEAYPVSASTICGLLGKPITQAQGEENGTLTIKFLGGSVFTVYDDDKQYESYQIKHGDKLIVV